MDEPKFAFPFPLCSPDQSTFAHVDSSSMRRSIISLAIMFGFLPVTTFASTTTDSSTSSIVLIVCGNDGDPVHSLGSGVLVGNSTVLTNAHVVHKDGQPYDWCKAGTSDTAYERPAFTFRLLPTPYVRDEQSYDYAFMTTVNDGGDVQQISSSAVYANADAMQIGDAVTLMGFPTSGGTTITVTSGEVVGYVDEVSLKTDARADAGNSGGGAFDEEGNLFGIVTRVTIGTYRTGYTIVQNINAIMEDAFGDGVAVRDLSTLYSERNTFCLSGACYNAAANESSWSTVDTEEPPNDDNALIVYTVPTHATFDALRYDAVTQERLGGSILLQVEQRGEAWYVNAEDGLRYYLRDGDVAYEMLRAFGLGITDEDLTAIPAAESVEEVRIAESVCDGSPSALRGRILLQVEAHGEAWYVDPETCRRVYMKDGDTAYATMRYLSLGITDEDLATLPYAHVLPAP